MQDLNRVKQVQRLIKTFHTTVVLGKKINKKIKIVKQVDFSHKC